MAGTVPVVHSLSAIYPDDAVAAQTVRWQQLLATFVARFGHAADFVARSPGRVNIIGEHIDYSLYSVLPMAITADCLMAVAVRAVAAPAGDSDTCTIQIANVDSRFPAHTFTGADAVAIDATVHEWSNYFKSGLRGALDLLQTMHGTLAPVSMQVLMDGNVPAGGGLSSSAAFTTTSALSVLFAHGETAVDKTALTELAVVSERSVGVNSGGMDQAASVFSERGSALYVSFTPRLTARPIVFPPTQPEMCFLIAQSFVAADKFVTGPVNYNLRVVECTLAAAYLHAVLIPAGTALPTDAGPLGISLHGFQEVYFQGAKSEQANERGGQKRQLLELLDLVQKVLPKDGYTRDEIAPVLGLDVAALNARYMARFPVRADAFKLRQRAQHVFGEALRVLQFMDLLEAETVTQGLDQGRGHTHPPADTSAYNAKLGALLNATQDSCRDLYECSCPELDRLCAIARQAGSYGSRLTGAGWGGCSVHLVPADRVEAVRAAWDREYYDTMDLTAEKRAAAVVVSRPSSGSAVLRLVDGHL